MLVGEIRNDEITYGNPCWPPSTLESNKVSFRGSGDIKLPKLNWLPTLKVKICAENSGLEKVLLMEEILHHLGCIKPCQQWDKPTYQLVEDFFHQQYVLFR